MDPGLTLLTFDAPPRSASTALVWPAALGALPLPLAAVDPAALAAGARTWPDLAPAQRVTWLLTVGDEPAAGAVVRALPWPPPGDLAAVLEVWSGQAAAALGLPADAPPALAVGANLPEVRAAFDDAVQVLPGLPHRWLGPVVVVVGNAPVPGLPPGETSFVRPVVPLLRLPALPEAGRTRAVVARRLVPLLLGLQQPPPGGMPPWLVRGLSGLAGAVADGRSPGPRAHLDRRASAGLAALERTLDSEDPDQALSEALAGALLVPWRREALTDLLDRLRSGSSSAAALAGATRITLADLCAQR